MTQKPFETGRYQTPECKVHRISTYAAVLVGSNGTTQNLTIDDDPLEW